MHSFFYKKVCVTATDFSTFVMGRSLGMDRPVQPGAVYKDSILILLATYIICALMVYMHQLNLKSK